MKLRKRHNIFSEELASTDTCINKQNETDKQTNRQTNRRGKNMIQNKNMPDPALTQTDRQTD